MIHPNPAKIIVPRKHGELLIEPALELQALALQQSSAGQFAPIPSAVFGTDFGTLRSMARESFLQAAVRWASILGVPPPPSDAGRRPVVITGHQVEFYHAGVWAKVIAADDLVRRVPSAVAFDLLVDYDIVDELGFEMPVQNGPDSWDRRLFTFAPPSNLPAENLRPPAHDEFLFWDSALAQCPASNVDSLAFFLSALLPKEGAAPQSYTAWMSSARTRFEASLGLRVHHAPTSLLCSTEAWLIFVRAWVDHAPRWTDAYNRHLAAYRKRQDIKNPQHPMPDLVRGAAGGGETYELPFWISKPGRPRERLVTQLANGKTLVALTDGQFDITVDLAPLMAAGYNLRPRALTLTMFTRLFLADLFIHGIGGALYDQITDALMLELFGVAPSYACVSAAWLLPLGQAFDPEDIAALRWRRHHIEHNPQLAIDPFTTLRTDVAELIRDRRQLIENIAASLGASRRDSAARTQRHTWFDQLHSINTQLHQKTSRLLSNLDHQIEHALRALDQNKVLLWREFFFALHTTESLHRLIAAIRST